MQAKVAAASAIAATATAVLLYCHHRRRRWRRWRELAAAHPRELMCDPRVVKALVPYPSAETSRLLSELTRWPSLKIRKFSAGARDGRCARPWHAGDAKSVGKKCKARHYYFLLHKPLGVVTQRDDASTRAYRDHAAETSRWRVFRRRAFLPTVFDGLPAGFPHVSPVGRLDKETSGLLLFTDDGALSTRLLRPRPDKGVSKTYVLDVAGVAGEAQLLSLAEPLEDVTKHSRETVFTKPAAVDVVGRRGAEATVRVTIAEGRHHQIRRLAARAGLTVAALHRERLGPLDLAGLPPGAARPLTAAEVDDCLGLVGLREKRGPPRPIPVPDAAPDLAAGDLAAVFADLERRLES